MGFIDFTKDRKRTQNESFYPILLVGMNNFCTLTPSKVLSFDNKNKKKLFFILYCAHLFVPLQK